MSSKKEEQINLYLNAITTRDPSKRQIKPVDKDAFQLFDDFESGSDEDFVLNSDEESDDNDDVKEESEEEADDNEEEEDDNGNKSIKGSDSEEDSEANNDTVYIEPKFRDSEIYDKDIVTKCKLESVMICMMCLMDVTYSDNEIIECDGCGVVVHEDCYKICDNVFISCDNSDASTDPWFCDACLNNVKDPRCELCPVDGGGVFKRTENNRWVHLLCALYTPGVAFNDVENLSEVTLSELPLKDWSGKECSICSNPFYAKTGVCISCDAGLCKNYFHVLCAQKEGLLSEPNIEENPDDPYFAQCLQHTDKETAKRRRKSWIAAVNRQKLRMEDWTKNGHFDDVRLRRKLEYFSSLDRKYRELAPSPFVPSNKVPCYLETSPVAVYLFKKKATNLRLPQDILNSYTTSDSKTGTGVPVFSPDFITYFLDREKKIDEMSSEITRLESFHRDMQISEQNTSHQFNKIVAKKESIIVEYKTSLDRLNEFIVIFKAIAVVPDVTEELERIITKYSAISSINDNGDSDTLNNSVTTTFNNIVSTKNDSVINECCICKSVGDQHLMIDCDDCSKFFHLTCLDPPLTRMPRKTKLYGWQCSSCVHVSSDEAFTKQIDINRPRQLRALTNICGRYKRYDNLTVSVNAKNRLLKNSKNIVNKRMKVSTSSTISPEKLIKDEIKLEDVKGKLETDSDIQRRKSHRHKKRPATLLDEFEEENLSKRCKYSKSKMAPPRKKSSRSLPLSKKGRFSSLKQSNMSLNLGVESIKNESEGKPFKQVITFFPSPAKNDSIASAVEIGIIAKKPVMVSRQIGIGKLKIFEKKPVLIKWHGDQDDVRSDKMMEGGGSQDNSGMSS